MRARVLEPRFPTLAADSCQVNTAGIRGITYVISKGQMPHSAPDNSSVDSLGPWISQLFTPTLDLNVNSEHRNDCTVSIVILSRNEERCISRCLDSIIGHQFDYVLVVDTGSTDNTIQIVEGYKDGGVELIETPWQDSFSNVRNLALEALTSKWVVFVDADEWVSEKSGPYLKKCLSSIDRIEDVNQLVFAPRIHDVDNHITTTDVPRIFRADASIRFKGPVHEYPYNTTDGSPLGVVGLNIDFLHDGYNQSVVQDKAKRERNLRLLSDARRIEPTNPRWLYYTIRDSLPTLDGPSIGKLCGALFELLDTRESNGDWRTVHEYYALALVQTCQRLANLELWFAVLDHCDKLEQLAGGRHPDAHYFRSVFALLDGSADEHDLLDTIRVRQDEQLVASSSLSRAGGHLDALIAELLSELRGRTEGARYRELCSPWTDALFDRSVLRRDNDHELPPASLDPAG
ncbi:glycosyltransferase [Amycolatopsis suaedae]|uniref:Glycosyltransferase n=1 Tax=Amycolatopsis suaedae TaxID=2510978 RepID=A0A4Q7JFF5_9PSEU|nr:glycosyltransferase [Amycolatopsis suaedae]